MSSITKTPPTSAGSVSIEDNPPVNPPGEPMVAGAQSASGPDAFVAGGVSSTVTAMFPVLDPVIQDDVADVVEWFREDDTDILPQVEKYIHGPYREHIRISSENILKMADKITRGHRGDPDSSKRPLVMILGAGPCTEIPLRKLAKDFRVILVDISLEDIDCARKNLPEELQPYVELRVRDVSGGITAKWVRGAKEIFKRNLNIHFTRARYLDLLTDLEKQVSDVDPTAGEDVDFLISTFVSNEMAWGPDAVFSNRFLEKYKTSFSTKMGREVFEKLAWKMTQTHVQGLARFAKRKGRLVYFQTEITHRRPRNDFSFIVSPGNKPVNDLSKLVEGIEGIDISAPLQASWQFPVRPGHTMFEVGALGMASVVVPADPSPEPPRGSKRVPTTSSLSAQGAVSSIQSGNKGPHRGQRTIHRGVVRGLSPTHTRMPRVPGLTGMARVLLR